MEANENSGLTTSYSTYPPHHHHHAPPSSDDALNHQPHQASLMSNDGGDVGGGGSMYPQTVAGKAPATEEKPRRKRGRPRKYGTPEAAEAAKRAAIQAKLREARQQQPPQFFGCGGASSHSSSASLASSSKKSNFASPGGQGFTPHVISVAAGEDVGQKIMLFMQQVKRELCILSASGSVASAALRQPSTSGGNIAYQGQFEIVSLTGSYVRSDQGGKAGGLSACLSSENGQIVGGGVCGPLIAAGPVEVIVATFLIDPKKDATVGFKGDVSANTMPSPASASPPVYRPVVESSGGFSATQNDDHRTMDRGAFMMQSQWRAGLNYDFTGNTGQESHDLPENGDYE